MKAFQAILFITPVVYGSSVFASESDMVYLLDGYCVRTEVKTELVEKMLIAAGGKKAPDSIVGKSPAMISHGGFAYLMKFKENKYIIALTNSGGCTVMRPNVKASEIEASLKRNYPLTNYVYDDAGVQVEKMWNIGGRSIYSGGVFSLTSPKKEFEQGGAVTVSYIPYSAVRQVMGEKK